jgi:hypothetical protein
MSPTIGAGTPVDNGPLTRDPLREFSQDGEARVVLWSSAVAVTLSLIVSLASFLLPGLEGSKGDDFLGRISFIERTGKAALGEFVDCGLPPRYPHA